MTRDGDMVWAEGDGPRILKRTKTGFVNLSAGVRLFQPNDLIADDRGGIYFTDPGPRPVVPGVKVNVYYIPPGGKPIIIDDAVPRPNGITLTRDGKTLIVDNTIGNDVFAYDVQPDGSVKNKRVFAKLHDIKAGEESTADGMAFRCSMPKGAISERSPCRASRPTWHSRGRTRRRCIFRRGRDFVD